MRAYVYEISGPQLRSLRIARTKTAEIPLPGHISPPTGPPNPRIWMPPPPSHSPRDSEEIDVPHLGYLISILGHAIPHGSHNGACADGQRCIRRTSFP